MFIQIGEKEYELSTKLGTAMAIERRFKIPVIQLFEKLNEATIDELVTIVEIAAKKTDDKTFRTEMLEHYDYLDLFHTVQGIVVRLMFSGTVEENEAKLAKYPASDEQKNVIRGLLGMPIPEAPQHLASPEPSTGIDS